MRLSSSNQIMLGDLEEDFPLNGGSDKLAKLFEENSLPDISFKFAVPKPPPARPAKNFQNNVPFKVIYGKTVEAFQMKVEGYKSEGKLGLAIIGNDEFCYYQLYMYRSDERKVTSAEITFNFAFLIQEHNYATFRDTHNIQWSVHFEKSADLVSFSKEIALARWRSSQSYQNKLVQEAFKGKTDSVAKKNDTLHVSYNIYSLSPENVVQEEIIGKAFTAPAGASTWETNLIGACVKSRRFVIIPSHLCSSLDASVPNGFHVMLDMEIVEITPPQSINTENLSSSVGSNTSKISIEKKEESENLFGRIARIGYALPSLQPPENESNSSLNDKPKTPQIKPMVSASTSSTYSTVSRDDPLPITNEPCDITASSQFNVLFSEVRTSNSEIRMNLNRVTDKVDSLLSKLDFLPQFNQKVLPTVEKYQNVDGVIAKLVEQNSTIMSLLEKNSPAQLESALNEIIHLKKRNGELESVLEVSGSTCQILKDKIAELNQKIYELEKLRNAEEVGPCSVCQGNGERKIRNLESSLKSLQDRNYALLEATEHLEKQNRELSEKVTSSQETKLRTQLGEKELKLAQLEREINKLSSKLRKNSDKDIAEKELIDAIKNMMNKTYRMLKEGLKGCVKDGLQLDQLLARILKDATAEYLESRKHHILFRVEEESSESLDEIPRREEAREQGNFSPSYTPLPLPVPRPRKPPPTPHCPQPSISESLTNKAPEVTPHYFKSVGVEEGVESPLPTEVKSDLSKANLTSVTSNILSEKNEALETIPESQQHKEHVEISNPSKDLKFEEISVTNDLSSREGEDHKKREHSEISKSEKNDSNLMKKTETGPKVDSYSSSYYAPLIPTTPPPIFDDASDESQES